MSAIISGSTTICSGTSSTITFTATPNTTVTYRVNGEANQTIQVGESGIAVLQTAELNTTTTYSLVSVAYTDPPACSLDITGTATVTVNPLVVVDAGSDQTVCSSSPAVTLAGSISGGTTTGSWSGGTGSFSPNANTLNAVYTPSATEISTGTVILTLTSADPAGPCPSAADQITITINPASNADAGVDQTICAGSNVTLAGTIGGGATSGTWSGGAGTFSPNVNTLNATYNPTSAEIASGSITLTLTTNDPSGPCGSVSDDVLITINPIPTVEAGVNQIICAVSVNLNGSIAGGAKKRKLDGGTEHLV